jgi:hypothetical protein
MEDDMPTGMCGGVSKPQPADETSQKVVDYVITILISFIYQK